MSKKTNIIITSIIIIIAFIVMIFASSAWMAITAGLTIALNVLSLYETWKGKNLRTLIDIICIIASVLIIFTGAILIIQILSVLVICSSFYNIYKRYSKKSE